MVTDDGEPVELVGDCKSCSRYWDDHCWFIPRQVASHAEDIGAPRAVRQPICPKPNERVARGPLTGDKQDMGWFDWLMEEETK